MQKKQVISLILTNIIVYFCIRLCMADVLIIFFVIFSGYQARGPLFIDPAFDAGIDYVSDKEL